VAAHVRNTVSRIHYAFTLLGKADTRVFHRGCPVTIPGSLFWVFVDEVVLLRVRLFVFITYSNSSAHTQPSFIRGGVIGPSAAAVSRNWIRIKCISKFVIVLALKAYIVERRNTDSLILKDGTRCTWVHTPYALLPSTEPHCVWNWEDPRSRSELLLKKKFFLQGSNPG
jgi:hypothetical protein